MKKNKKVKDGLALDSDCSLVTGSGFKADKESKKNKGINRKAGLHGKANKEDGERRVRRRKPLALKHRHRIRKAVAALSAVAVICIAFVGYGFFKAPDIVGLEGEYATVCYETPDDGSDPTMHTAVENVGYMNYVLKQQSFWSSSMTSEVKTIISQYVQTYKSYYGGVLVSADITTSSMVNSAKQFCVSGDVVMWRNSASGKASDWNGMDTDWAVGAPEGLTRNEYKANRGFPPDEFSVYVINENTVNPEGTSPYAVKNTASASSNGGVSAADTAKTVANGDGTYSVTLNLNTNLGLGGNDDPATSAVYYYKQQMLVTGGLTDYPTYDSIVVTYTFDANWRVLSTAITEAYSAKMGISASCVSTSLTVYDYDDEQLCKDNYDKYYAGYFEANAGNFSAPSEGGLNVTNALSAAFGGVIVDGAVFKLDFAIDGNPVNGVVYVGMESGALSRLSAEIGNVKADYFADDGYIYLEYGGIKLKLDSKALAGLLSEREDGDVESDGSASALDEILSQLSGGEFTVSEDGTEARLVTAIDLCGLLENLTGEKPELSEDGNIVMASGDITLELPASIPLEFSFCVDGGDVTLNVVETEVFLFGMKLDATLSFGSENDIPETPDRNAFTDINSENRLLALVSMFGSDYYSVTADYSSDIFSLTGEVKFGVTGKNILADLVITLGGEEKTVELAYDDGIFYLSLGMDGREPVRFKATAAEAEAIISKYLGGEDGLTSSLIPDETQIGGLIYKVLADGDFAALFNLSGDCSLTVDGTSLLAALGYEFALGEAAVTINADGSLSVSALSLDATLKSCAAFVFDRDDYAEATDAVALFEKVNGVLSDGGVSLTGDVKVLIDGTEAAIEISRLSVKWSGGLTFYACMNATFGGEAHDIYILYRDGVADMVYDNFGLQISASDIESLLTGIEDVYAAATGGELDLSGVKNALSSVLGGAVSDGGSDEIESDQIDADRIIDIVNSLALSSAEGGNIRLDYGGFTALLVPVPADGEGSLFGISLSYGDIFEADGAVVSLMEFGDMPDVTYADAATFIALLNNVADVLGEGGISLGGKIYISTAKTEIELDVSALSVKWKDGLSISVRADVIVSGNKIPLYVNYADGLVNLVYGEAQNFVAVKLGAGDLDALSAALVETYNRIAAVVNTVLEGNANDLSKAESLDDVLALLNGGEDAAFSLSKIFGLLGINSTEGGENGSPLNAVLELLGLTNDGQFDLLSAISSAKISNNDDGLLGIELGNIRLDLRKATDGGYLNLTATVTLGASTPDAQIFVENAALKPYAPVTTEVTDYLTADDLANMLEYLAMTAELLVEDEMSLSVTGTLKEGTVTKYDLKADLEYVQGGSGYPLKVDWGDESKSITLDSDVYVHLNIEMTSHVEGVDSLALDVYMLDATPQTGGGVTTETATKDGELDIYLSVSKLAVTDKNSAPLKIYVPVGEVLRLGSIVAAMLDLGSVNTGYGGFDEIISYVAQVLDQLLISKYIPDTREQFSSLGSSLIRQIVGKDVSALLEMLAEGLGYEKTVTEGAGNAAQTLSGEGTEIAPAADGAVLDASFIKSVKTGENSFEIVFNSTAIYKRPVTANIVFKAEKERLGGAESDSLKSLSISNVYIDSTLKNLLSLNLGIGRSVEKATAFAGYTDFSELDNLLESVINSATHATDGGYALNDNFFISGEIALSVLAYNPTIKIDGASISLDENNKLSANIKLSYEKFTAIFGAVVIIDQTATVDLSVRNDMIYIRKTTSGGEEWRIMTLSAFAENILDQLTFILSLGSTVTDNISDGGSGGTMPVTYDYGDMISAWLKSYTYSVTDTAASWTFTLNGDTVSALAGVTISDIPVTISGTSDGDGAYTLSELSLSGKLFSVISFKAEFGYRNPKGVMAEGYSDGTSDLANGVKIYGDYVWSDILGGDSSGLINKHIKWSAMLAELGTDYLGYTSGGNVKIGEIGYAYRYAEYENSLGSELALYNGSTKTVYTRLSYPDLSAYEEYAEKHNKTVVWATEYELTDGVPVFYATLDDTYSVTVKSHYNLGGFTECTDDDGNVWYEYTYNNAYRQLLLPKDLVVEIDGKFYGLKGYGMLLADASYADCEFTTAYNDDGALCYVLAVSGDVTLKAVWQEVFAVAFSADGYDDITVYYYADQDISENLPAVPEKTGYTGRWLVESGTYVSASGYTVYAEYAINSYTLTVYSDLLPADSVCVEYYDNQSGEWIKTEAAGWSQSGSGYMAEFTFDYGTQVSFENSALGVEPATYIFHGYFTDDKYLNAATEVSVSGDVTYYVSWEVKQITVTYMSYNADGGEITLKAESLSGEYALLTEPAAPAEDTASTVNGVISSSSYRFLGWWYEDAELGWICVDDVTPYAAADYEEITVYALWVNLAIEGTAVRSSDGWGVKYYYTISISKATYTLLGQINVINNISATGTNYLIYLNNDGSTSSDKDLYNQYYDGFADSYNPDRYTWSGAANSTKRSMWNVLVTLTLNYCSDDYNQNYSVNIYHSGYFST